MGLFDWKLKVLVHFFFEGMQFCCSFLQRPYLCVFFFSYCFIFPFLYLLYYLLLSCFLLQCAYLCFFIFIFLYFPLSMLFTLFFTFLLVNIFPFQSENSSSCLRLMNLLSLGCRSPVFTRLQRGLYSSPILVSSNV